MKKVIKINQYVLWKKSKVVLNFWLVLYIVYIANYVQKINGKYFAFKFKKKIFYAKVLEKRSKLIKKADAVSAFKGTFLKFHILFAKE